MSDNKEVQTLYKEVLRIDWDKAKAAIGQQAAEIERLKREAKNDAIAYRAAIARQEEIRAELAALRAQQPGVVLPERKLVEPLDFNQTTADVLAQGWNLCIDAVKRLNSSPVSSTPSELTNVRCQCCQSEHAHDSYDAGFIVGSGMCQVCDAAMPAKDLPTSAAWMMPTAKQLEQALESVPSFHDLRAELIAPAMLDHLREVISAGEYGDAYRGARDESLIWKRRALEAETKVREQDQIIENLGDALNAENGPTLMGKPVIRAGGVYSADPLACSGCVSGCFRCRAGGVDERASFEAAFQGKTNFERNEQHSDFYAHLPARQMWDAWMARAALTASAQIGHPDDSSRLCKLLGWMSSNVEEGWNEVCRIASVATYVSHEEARAYLDDLPECSVGLAAAPAPGKVGDSV